MLRGIVCGLAALLALACGLAAVGVRAQDPADPLTLELQSSRNLCTAGTPTEISWQIAGGVPPYTLSVEGETVDADAESHRINCGALTEAEATDEDAALEPKQITATVTDSRGVQREASLDVARARPLPAPTATARVLPNPNAIGFEWLGARGSAPCDAEEPFAVRWRRRGATEWSHNLYQSSSHDPCKVRLPIRGLEEGIAYEASIAALRDSIELNNPEALQWTRAAQGTTVTTPSGVTVNATHNSVTIRWNRQPSAYWYTVSLAGPNGGLSARLARDLDGFAWGATASGMHEVVFRHLPPATAFTVYVGIPTTVHEKRLSTKTRVQTKAAPADWTPLPRGAQNVRASATADSITVRWDAPFVGADDSYEVVVYHPRYPSKPLFKWVYRNEFSQGGLEPGVTYRVIIEHDGVVKAPKEIQVTTIAETPSKARRTPPPFEWWANGKPATPLLYLELTSSRNLCTADTLTELSWQIAGGVPPYTLTIDGSAVDIDADNLRINCGALPHDPRTGELAASRAKTFRGSLRDSRGVTASATAPVTLTTPPYLAADTALRYETYDLTGAAASAGSYAFLTDTTGAASVVATYEGLRDGTAKQLLVHQADAQGVSRTTLYAAVAAGDLFEWRESYDCWVRYRVTEVRPDPQGGAARKLLGVEQLSYAYSGCSGAIATDAAVLIAWGPLPDLGGPSLAAPLRHGPYQLVPEDWAGRVEEDPFRPWPGNSFANPVHTAELAEARRLPYWRDPKLPAGWTFSGASSGDPSFDPPYGYCAYWQNDRGYGGVEICGGFQSELDRPRKSSWNGGRGGVIETRTIDGRSAVLDYSPPGPNHNRYLPTQVWVYDPIPGAVYYVRGLDWTLNGSNVDAVIAIARSLFTTAAPTAGDAASPGASGNRDALPFVELALQREGRA